MKTYIPTPIDTSDVQLSPELLGLTELLAQNVHEVWAAGRIADGWQWGEVRNDALKHHPCLVPYNELPEVEREYDRNTAMDTLRTIVKLGFEL